jgi:hypothetical protein
VTEELMAKLQELLGDNDLAGTVAGLAGGAGGFDPGALLGTLQANPGLLEALKDKLGDNPLATLQGLLPGGEGGGLDLGALGGIMGQGEGGQGPDLGGLGDTLGGLLGNKG